MQIGMIGLGRMGGNIVRRLLQQRDALLAWGRCAVRERMSVVSKGVSVAVRFGNGDRKSLGLGRRVLGLGHQIGARTDAAFARRTTVAVSAAIQSHRGLPTTTSLICPRPPILRPHLIMHPHSAGNRETTRTACSILRAVRQRCAVYHKTQPCRRRPEWGAAQN